MTGDPRSMSDLSAEYGPLGWHLWAEAGHYYAATMLPESLDSKRLGRTEHAGTPDDLAAKLATVSSRWAMGRAA